MLNHIQTYDSYNLVGCRAVSLEYPAISWCLAHWKLRNGDRTVVPMWALLYPFALSHWFQSCWNAPKTVLLSRFPQLTKWILPTLPFRFEDICIAKLMETLHEVHQGRSFMRKFCSSTYVVWLNPRTSVGHPVDLLVSSTAKSKLQSSLCLINLTWFGKCFCAHVLQVSQTDFYHICILNSKTYF